MSALTLFPKRIPEPKKMERIEMEAFDLLSKANYRRWTRPIVEYFFSQTGIRRGRILDVACGPGIMSREFGKTSATLSVVGLDISKEALRLARKNTKGMRNVSFVKSSVYRLPFKKGSFDAVVCKDSFHHFNKPEKAITEMLRVVKPDGYVYIQDMRRDLPDYLIERSTGKKNIIEKLQYYSTRAAYTKQEIKKMLSKMRIYPSHLAIPRVTMHMKKTYPRAGISIQQLKEGLGARYNLLIRKSRAYGASATL